METKISSKKELAKILSKLEGFYEPKVRDEQYPTDSEIASEILWNAFLLGDCEGKVIADFGCGNGQLGIGALLLGAKKTILIDKDIEILRIAEKNYEIAKSEFNLQEAQFIEKDITKIESGTIKADVLFQNPPFGTKEKHADIKFLEKAMITAPVIYTIHKASTKNFINKFINEKKYITTHYYEKLMPLKKSMQFHKSTRKNILIGIWRIK